MYVILLFVIYSERLHKILSVKTFDANKFLWKKLLTVTEIEKKDFKNLFSDEQ